MRSTLPRAALLLALLLGLAACSPASGGEPAQRPTGHRPTVVANFYPVAWLAERIGGRAVGVSTLTPAGTEPHDLTLTARQLGDLERADAVLYLGAGFQPDVERATAQLPGSVRRLDLLDAPGVSLLPAPADLGKEPLAGGKDPHVWLDPVRMAAMARAVGAALAQLAPDRAAELHARTRAAVAELEELDRRLAAQLDGCAGRTVVTSHAAFGYLASRYHLRQLAIAGLAPDDEPDPNTLGQIAAAARARRVRTVFFEEALPPRMANTVAAEIGAGVDQLAALEFDPRQAIAADQDYLSVQRRNGHAIASGLGCR
jgi:zinc transport system substrate-binding protein